VCMCVCERVSVCVCVLVCVCVCVRARERDRVRHDNSIGVQKKLIHVRAWFMHLREDYGIFMVKTELAAGLCTANGMRTSLESRTTTTVFSLMMYITANIRRISYTTVSGTLRMFI
jgi:hypothetical protein